MLGCSRRRALLLERRSVKLCLLREPVTGSPACAWRVGWLGTYRVPSEEVVVNHSWPSRSTAVGLVLDSRVQQARAPADNDRGSMGSERGGLVASGGCGRGCRGGRRQPKPKPVALGSKSGPG